MEDDGAIAEASNRTTKARVGRVAIIALQEKMKAL